MRALHAFVHSLVGKKGYPTSMFILLSPCL